MPIQTGMNQMKTNPMKKISQMKMNGMKTNRMKMNQMRMNRMKVNQMRMGWMKKMRIVLHVQMEESADCHPGPILLSSEFQCEQLI